MPSLVMRSYGWIFLLLLGLTIAVGMRFVSMVRESRAHPHVGDGRNPSTYGFDLQNLTIPRDQLTARGLPKNRLKSLDLPEIYSAEKSMSFRGRSKYLVPTDLVIGVWVDGHTRAYPLQILNWHEVVNDTLGGAPIVISYSPLAGAATAYERNVDRNAPTDSGTSVIPDLDKLREFGVSGLYWNGHHLLYDRQKSPDEESLWSPLLGGPIAGPAVEFGEKLETLATALVPWKLWHDHYPGTTVLGRDEMQLARYKRKPYVSYFGNDEIQFPVTPLPDRSKRRWKSRIVIPILEDGQTSGLTALSVSGLARDASGAAQRAEVQVGAVRMQCVTSENPPAAMLLNLETGEPFPTRNAYWFAWYSTHPGGAIR